MDLSNISNAFKNWLDSILHSDWLSTLITIVIIVVITAICAHLVTMFLRKLFKMNKALPAVSIFINIGRVTIWVIGLCVILSSCFNVNVGAAVTALGIGGIAISLGFQSTLSNLIGGLQIIMTKLIEPGDRIKVGDYSGMVTDVTWRHTAINTVRGEKVIIPNSVINTSALVKLAPEDDIRVDIIITPEEGESLEDVVSKMQDEVNEAVGKIAVMKEDAQINVTGKVERGYQALLTFSTGKGTKRSVAIDTAMKAVAGSAKRTKSHKKATAKDSLIQQRDAIKEANSHVIDKIEDEVHKIEHHGASAKEPKKGNAITSKADKPTSTAGGDATNQKDADGNVGK